MDSFLNGDGKRIVCAVVKAIQEKKDYLGEVDGLIGDGDHGMNMNKGFSLFQTRFAEENLSFTQSLEELGLILLNEIGGSMGPIYGTIFLEMAECKEEAERITLEDFTEMLEAGLAGLCEIVEAKVGDKTLVDTLTPAVRSLQQSVKEKSGFYEALQNMKKEAEKGRDSTKELVARFGRSSRLGERSRGVLDAGATSCCIILCSMADAILSQLQVEK